ncbi:MAG: AAA family ATPase, partial [Anaerolineae bacterium]|nr:AAA family ATPase [Anaerolineae bacterium]
GMEGEGKSTVLCGIGAAVTQGQGLDDMVFDNGPENVLWMSAEDSPEQILKPRLLAAGADPFRVFVIGEPFTFDDKGIELVREMIERRRPALVVIDPIFAYVLGDPNKGADTRATTNKLKQLAEEFDCAIVLVRHIGKSKGFGDPRAAGLYSIEWRAAARSVLLCGSDPDSQQIKALTQSKNNLSPFADSVGFVIEEHPPGSEVSRIMWTGVSQLTAKRILSVVSNEEETAERADAEEFLRESLISGDQLANGVKAEARKLGISPATLNRARWNLGVVSRKAQGQKHGPWYWGLRNEASQHDQNGFVDHLDLSTMDTTIADEKQVKVINDHVDSRESPHCQHDH